MYIEIQWMFLSQPPFYYNNHMESLNNKMRELAIHELKNRRELIFQTTRNLFDMKGAIREMPDVIQTENEQEDQPEEFRGESYEKMELEEKKFMKQHMNKKKQSMPDEEKAKRYWRQLLQVNQRLVSVPANLQDYYVASRPQGIKCLMIFKQNQVFLSDKCGSTVASFGNPIPSLSGTVFESYWQKDEKKIVVTDLIIWKSQTYASSQLDFRYAWLQSNLRSSLGVLSKQLKHQVIVLRYHSCNLKGLENVYSEEPPYKRDGLLLIYKFSYYEPGHNPSSLVWKDQHTSPYYQLQCMANKQMSKGMGYINKRAEVVSLDNRVLFLINRSQIGKRNRFVKFTYQDMEIKEDGNGNFLVGLVGLNVVQSYRVFDGRVDSLSKLYYKCCLKRNRIPIQSLAAGLK